MTELLINKIDSLPELPSTILELEDFRKEDNPSSESLIKIIEKDPLMVTTILKIANSSMFGFRSSIDTLSRAINLLGVSFTISIAFGTVIQNNIKSNLNAYDVSIDDFINTSALAIKIVNTWITSVNFDLKEELLMPAFLQETGKFIISDVIQKENNTKDFLEYIEDTNCISEAESKFTGYSCARITANIFKHWGLSPNLIFSIGFVGKLDSCPKDFKQHAQILEIVKILTNIKSPLSDESITKALSKVNEYGLDEDRFLNSIDAIKEEMSKSS